jgi:histidyl-tRNA synthetase
MAQKPSIPKGTRDFLPFEVARRNYIFDTIKASFKNFGFLPIETPSFELSSTLMGKYGEEGDRLIFRILNSGDKQKKADIQALEEGNLPRFANSLSEKALRYDLTVPFARCVAMNHGQLTFPFKRYQIQPVWRADRPQKGRYREFYQCDADIIGTNSLWCEWELVKLYDAVFSLLKIPVVIHVNNRKVLQALANASGMEQCFNDMTVALDKLDKIGWDGVEQEMANKGIAADNVAKLKDWLEKMQNEPREIQALLSSFGSTESMAEVDFFNQAAQMAPLQQAVWKWDFTLARGLNYYTGFIFEVKALNVEMGSIGGGGRYDDLTGIFGVKDLSGVGISFGADRIYDVMESLNLFPPAIEQSTKVLIAYFDSSTLEKSVQLLYLMRSNGIASELYPEESKMKKQFKYADDKHIPYVIVIGEEESANGTVNIKNMTTGNQLALAFDDVIDWMKNELH